MRKQIVAVSLTMMSVLAWAPADGGVTSLTFEFSPGEGQPGTVVEFSGTCMMLEPEGTAHVSLYLVPGQPGVPFDFSTQTALDDDGSFVGSVAVPDDAPTGEYRINAECVFGDYGPPGVQYGFTVTEGPTTSTSTSTSTTSMTSPTSTSTTTPSTTTTVPPTATPTQVAPTFTG